jgi:hypothetical protein
VPFGEHFGQCYGSGSFRAAGDEGGDNESVEASRHPPTCRFGDRARVTFGRADQVSYRRADVRQPTIFRLKNLVDHAHLDRVPGFGIDQNEAASLLVVGITVDRNATVELENTPANAVD